MVRERRDGVLRNEAKMQIQHGRISGLRAGRQHVDRRVALCPQCHAQTDAPYVRGRLVITPRAHGRFTFAVIRGTDKWAPRG